MSEVKSRTLEGRRIAITRAAAQSKELRERLEELGAEVISLPLIRFVEPENTNELDHAIRSIEDFDWLIFTGANAVTFFLHRCRSLGCRPNAKRTKIAAVGSATRLALENEGLAAALVPGEFSGAGLAAELGDALAGKKVLLPRSDRASRELPELLGRAGANVTEVIAYRTAGPEAIDRSLLDAIGSGKADAVAFFSPSAFREFEKLMGADRDWNRNTAFAAVGPVTAAAIRGAGLPVAIEAEEATTASLVAGLEHYFLKLSEAGSQQGLRNRSGG